MRSLLIFSTVLLVFLAFSVNPANAQAQIKTPVPSPSSMVTQQIGIMEVTVNYSRPGVKGRKIFGGLVPFGELWRTGANATTKFTFSDEVSIEGTKIPAGDYGLYTIPDEDEWTIIFNKKLGWGTGQYDEKEDVARFTVKPIKHPNSVQTFTIGFANVTDNSAYVELNWENTIVQFKIEFDVDAKVMAQIEKVMENPEAGLANTYYSAADYYFNNDKDQKKALEWVSKAVEINPDAYWMLRLKSRVQAKMGDYKNAIKTAELGKAAAQKANNQQYVKYNEEAIAEWGKM
jgi:hypothetical protein